MAWGADDVSLAKGGRMSAGVAPRCCGALGERANCHAAVGGHVATDAAFCPPRSAVPAEGTGGQTHPTWAWRSRRCAFVRAAAPRAPAACSRGRRDALAEVPGAA
ncbi:transposase [Streptomyces griseoincarnatus]